MLLQMVKFGFVGLTATAIHAAMLLFLVEKLGVGPVLASIPAFLTALAISFLINHHWTFVVKGAYGRYFSRYAAVSAAGLILNITIMYGAVSLMHQSYVVGLGVVIIFVPLISFLLQRYWTFSDSNQFLPGNAIPPLPLRERAGERGKNFNALSPSPQPSPIKGEGETGVSG